jgi:hypothetical protein
MDIVVQEPTVRDWRTATPEEILDGAWDPGEDQHPSAWHLLDLRLHGTRIQQLAATERRDMLGAENGCAPPSEERLRTIFDPPLLRDLPPQPPQEWLIAGLVGRGLLSMITGHPKVGKSTFIAAMIGSIAKGDAFLDRPSQSVPVAWLNLEAPEALTEDLIRRACGPEAEVRLHHRAAPNLKELEAFITRRGIGLVVVDSLGKFWTGVRDWSDKSQITTVSIPLLEVARRTRCAFVLVHHNRKSGGEDGLEAAGSHEIAASMDIMISMSRCGRPGLAGQSDRQDPSRLLRVTGRFMDLVPPSMVIELTDLGYQNLGSPGRVKRKSERAAVLAVLTTEPKTSVQVAEETGLSGQAARTVLKLLVSEHAILRSASGKRSDPYTYWQNDCAQSNSLACAQPMAEE